MILWSCLTMRGIIFLNALSSRVVARELEVGRCCKLGNRLAFLFSIYFLIKVCHSASDLRYLAF